MSEFRWRVVGGDFGVASNWANTTLKINPARVGPGLADNVTFATSGGTVTDVGAVAGMTIDTSTATPWTLAGRFSAASTNIGGAATISGALDAGTLVVRGAGALTATGGGTVRAGSLTLAAASSLSVTPSGMAIVGTSAGSLGAVTLDAGTVLDAGGGGHVTGAVVDNGALATGGGFLLTGDLLGAGTLSLSGGQTTIDGDLSIGAVSFGSALATLSVQSLHGTIHVTGFQPGDVVELTGQPGGAPSFAAGTLVALSGGALEFGQAPGGFSYSINAAPAGGALITLSATQPTLPPPTPPVQPAPPPVDTPPPGTGPADPAPPPIDPPPQPPVDPLPPTPPAPSAPNPAVLPADAPVSTVPGVTPPSTGVVDPPPAPSSVPQPTPLPENTVAPIAPATAINSGFLAGEAERHGAPVQRFFDASNGAHFLTADPDEQATIRATRPELKLESQGFDTDDAQSDGSGTIFRLFDLRTGDHLLTASADERDRLLQLHSTFKSEGAAFYAHSGPADGYVPVYRFFDASNGGHMFTASEAERGTLLSTGPQMRAEGIAFYAPST